MEQQSPRGGFAFAPILRLPGTILTRRSFMTLSILVLSLVLANAAENPNIIVILVDDLGYADVGIQGCQDFATPHIDQLANDGVRCTAGYISCPVCSPSRAGLLTGRYQQRFGFEYNPTRGPDNGLPSEEETIGDLLTPAGYVTGAIGKWHLGQHPKFHPLNTGFSEFYGFIGGARPFFPLTGEPGTPTSHPLIPNDPLVRNGTRVDDPEYLTDAFGHEAVEFIERHKHSSFFLYLAFNAVHVPLEATHRYLDRVSGIPRTDRRTYAAMMIAVDDAVGRIRQKLQQEVLDRRTLIFFLSDNGGHPPFNAARNDPLRGMKSTVYEGGIRTPYFVTWPGRLPAGVSFDHPVISLDILPTTLAAAGVDFSSELSLDGVNLLPHLIGESDQPPHETLYWRYGRHHAIRHRQWKLTTPADEPSALYDLSADIAESQDLSDDHPEVVRHLTTLYQAWDAEMETPRWRSFFMKDAPGRRRNR